MLVRVHASSVTRSDCGLRDRSDYFFARIFTGLVRPKRTIAGMEFAGVVEEVGAAVTQLAAGDEVFGIKGGANAEYVCVPESGVIARKPSSLGFEEAAGVVDGGLSAFTMLPALGPIEGRHIVVYGAGGSIGTASVQVAKHLGARVTAVCGTEQVELVRSLGADEVVDYLREDWTRRGTYDGVLDAVGKSSFRKARRALKPGAAYVSADLGYMWHLPLLILPTRWLGSHKAKLGIVALPAGGPDPPAGADRGGRLPAGDRPHVPARGRRRGDAVRRDPAEDRQRRPDRERGRAEMRAVVRERYGWPDVLELRELEKPEPADDEVLVRVRAASVNRAEWYSLTGRPYIARPTGACARRRASGSASTSPASSRPSART